MATLAIGSAFMHQSYSYVGSRFDNLMISVISYLSHKMMVQNLPNKSLMVSDLQWEPRTVNVSQLINNITETIATKPVPEWAQILDTADYPRDYISSFGAIVCNFFAFVFPENIVTPLITILAYIILPAKQREWLTHKYLPEIVEATKNNNIPILRRIGLLIRIVGVSIKMIFGFAFQE